MESRVCQSLATFGILNCIHQVGDGLMLGRGRPSASNRKRMYASIIMIDMSRIVGIMTTGSNIVKWASCLLLHSWTWRNSGSGTVEITKAATVENCAGVTTGSPKFSTPKSSGRRDFNGTSRWVLWSQVSPKNSSDRRQSRMAMRKTGVTKKPQLVPGMWTGGN